MTDVANAAAAAPPPSEPAAPPVAHAPAALAGVAPDHDERFGLMDRLSALSGADCAEIEARVLALRPRWSTRRWRGTFTIGRATYADAANGADAQREYHDQLPAANRLLRERFGDLLELVRARLERHLGEPVAFYERAALPGFHIFAPPGIPVGDRGTPHFDLQHRYIAWPSPPDEGRLLSFTLPIATPAAGAGMDLWDLTQPEYQRIARGGDAELSREQVIRTTPMVRCPYVPGRLHLQSRMLLHRIAGIPSVAPDDLRITLQGHAVRLDGRWLLYW